MEVENHVLAVKRKLTNVERQRVVELLIQNLSNNGKPPRGLINDTAKQFETSRKTISRLWQIAKKQIAKGEVLDVKSKMAGRVGRKKSNIDMSKLSEIPLHRRTNIRSLSKALGVPKSTTHRLVQEGQIRSHTNAIRPYLTQENIKKRLAFCLSKIQPTNTNTNPLFEDFYNTIHIDEKWFFMTKTSQKYYLHPLETPPTRTCKSKHFITKIMFLAAVARPRFGRNGEVIFDGKIGIFPFTFVEAAKRKSKNRDAGVLETKPIVSITKEVMRECIIEKVIPAIKQKWPVGDKQTIYIQQDNAKPHIDPTDCNFINTATSDGFDIRMTCQPANSPDLNVLDLGFFRAIQSLQYENSPKNVVELVEVVQNSFLQLEPTTLNHVWLSLQLCMNEILKVGGMNDYKIPHVGKHMMQHQGTLPTSFSADPITIQTAISVLNDSDAHSSRVELSSFEVSS